ncbi:Protein TIFY 4B-like isoform X1 [Ranunculus cassubicifolius]
MKCSSVNFGVHTGTRRPLSNKSQATEQVIFLKPLPESLTESKNHALFRQRIQVPHPENSPQLLPSENGYVGDMQISASVNENDLWQRRG